MVNVDMENALMELIHFACYDWYHRWRCLNFVDMQLHVWIQLITGACETIPNKTKPTIFFF